MLLATTTTRGVTMSSNTKQVPCQNCAEPMARWPVNRKYCGVCQIVRDDVRRQGKPIKPRACEGYDGLGHNLKGEKCGTFYPVRSSFKKCYCCTDWQGGEREHYPECDKCGKRYRTAFGLTKTCMQCVQSSEELRKVYLRQLHKIYQDRMADPTRQQVAEQAREDAVRGKKARDDKKARQQRMNELYREIVKHAKGDMPKTLEQLVSQWHSEFPDEPLIY